MPLQGRYHAIDDRRTLEWELMCVGERHAGVAAWGLEIICTDPTVNQSWKDGNHRVLCNSTLKQVGANWHQARMQSIECCRQLFLYRDRDTIDTQNTRLAHSGCVLTHTRATSNRCRSGMVLVLADLWLTFLGQKIQAPLTHLSSRSSNWPDCEQETRGRQEPCFSIF